MARTKKNKPGGARRQAELSDFVGQLSGQPLNNAADAESINKLKKKIRDVERLLQGRKDLPAGIEVDKQRELKSLQHDLQHKMARKERSKLIGQYHKIRFFERQKADRRLKQLNRNLQECKDPSKKSALERRTHVTQVDLNYALYYPLLVHYKPLFRTNPGKDGEKPDDESEEAALERRRKNEMWLRVESATNIGRSALQALRDEDPSEEKPKAGVANDTGRETPRKNGANSALVVGRTEAKRERDRKPKTTQEGDGSDDNFFE